MKARLALPCCLLSMGLGSHAFAEDTSVLAMVEARLEGMALRCARRVTPDRLVEGFGGPGDGVVAHEARL